MFFLFVLHPVPNGFNCHQSVKLVSHYFSCLRLNSYLLFFVITKKLYLLGCETHYLFIIHSLISTAEEKPVCTSGTVAPYQAMPVFSPLNSEDAICVALLHGCNRALLYLLAAAKCLYILIQVPHIFLKK